MTTAELGATLCTDLPAPILSLLLDSGCSLSSSFWTAGSSLVFCISQVLPLVVILLDVELAEVIDLVAYSWPIQDIWSLVHRLASDPT